RTVVLKTLYCRFFWLTPVFSQASPTITPLARGRNRCKRRRSGRRRTLRASVLRPTLPGRLRAPNPADTTTRSKCSNSEELRANAAQDCYLGLVGDPDSLKCRGGAPAGARPPTMGRETPHGV